MKTPSNTKDIEAIAHESGFKNSDEAFMSAFKNVRKTIKMYKIKGDVSPEMYQIIDSLRQIINEEFVARGESISSQALYDLLNPKVLPKIKVQEAIVEARMSILKEIANGAKTQTEVDNILRVTQLIQVKEEKS